LFIYSAVTTWLTQYDRRKPHFRVRTCETGSKPARIVEDGYFTVVLNTNPYTFLGNRPLDLSTRAGLDKPLVAITFKTLALSAIAKTLAGALRGGGISEDESSDHVVSFADVREMVIENPLPFPYQVDGDYLGETNRLHIEHIPEAVELLFPL
jgi:diacylglycerol kinase family enzyme